MRLLSSLSLAVWLLAMPAWGETVTYYVWTDDDGTINAAHTPPDDRAFETHTIELDTGTASPSGGDDERGGDVNTSQASSDATVGASTDGAEEAVISAEEENLLQEELAQLQEKIEEGLGTPEDKRRLEEIKDRLNIDTAGADVAPGADTATPGSTAESASGAASGSTAGSANTAPGWLTPPPTW